MVEAYYTDDYLEGKLTFKVGRQYADTDFGGVENGADFLNSSYGLIPTIPMPTFPAPKFGGSVWVALKSWLAMGSGIFQGDQLGPMVEGAIPGQKGAFTLAEVKVTPLPEHAAIHGSYHVGVWQQGKSSFLRNGSDGKPSANFGFYATGDQWFRKANAAVGNSGPQAFFQVGWAPSDRNLVHRYVGGGMAWPGLVPKRDHDSIGAGVTAAWLCGTQHAEMITEVFYKLQVNARINLQPDLQYAHRPGGKGENAWLGGLRLGLAF